MRAVTMAPLGRAAAALLLAGLLPARAAAHEGPPFPVLVDEVEGPWSISVWADPDVGLGTFWVQLEAADGRTLPGDTRVTVHVAPADGRLAETSWPAERQGRDGGEQHVAEVDFPTREFWTVRVVVASEAAGLAAERLVRVEVTPPGYGPIDLLLYLWPFLAVAALWLKAMLKHRAAARAPDATHAAAPGPRPADVEDPLPEPVNRHA